MADFWGELSFPLTPSESVEEAREAKKEARRRQRRARRLRSGGSRAGEGLWGGVASFGSGGERVAG